MKIKKQKTFQTETKINENTEVSEVVKKNKK